MCVKTYICNGKCVGLMIDNFNISSRMIKNLDITYPLLSSVECKPLFHDFLNENGDIIRWSSFKNVKDFCKVLRLLNDENLSVGKDFFLKPIDKKYLLEIATYTRISSYWKSHPIRGTKAIVSNDGSVVGLIRYLVEGNNSLYITMIEIFDKNRGYGTKVINELIASGKSINGVSYESALNFWSKFDAKIDYRDNRFTILNM